MNDENRDESSAAMYEMTIERERRLEAEASLTAQRSRRAEIDELADATRWDPRRVGWNTPPSAEVLIAWIFELGRYRNVRLEELADGGWSALAQRRGRPHHANYSSLPEACAAIDNGTVWKDLQPDLVNVAWSGSDDAMDHAWQGGAPGLGKRR